MKILIAGAGEVGTHLAKLLGQGKSRYYLDGQQQGEIDGCPRQR